MFTKPSYRHIPATEVAKIARRELKQAFGKSVKFSVRTDTYAGGSSSRVTWEDGPTERAVEKIIGHLHGATFDGMTDMKSYHTSTEYDTAGQEHEVSYGNDFIFASRTLTDQAMDRALAVATKLNPWRSFRPDFADETIAHDNLAFAPAPNTDPDDVRDYHPMSSYMVTGRELLYYYARHTDMTE